MSEVWVIFDVPASIPRWSPGPEWIEAAHGEYWIRPQADGQHEVMVLTYDRERMSEWEVEEFTPQALVSAVIGEDHWFGTFADKPHRIYTTGFVRQPLTVVPIEHDHPAVAYNEAWEEARTTLWNRAHELQPPSGAHSLWLGPEVQIKPDGSGWYLTLHATMGGILSPNEEYWADIIDLSITVQRFMRVYNAKRVYIQRDDHGHFTDPLWQPAMAAIQLVEEN